MSNLQFNSDNTVLSCPCGAHVITISAWNVMTEHQRTDKILKAGKCPTCKGDKERKKSK